MKPFQAPNTSQQAGGSLILDRALADIEDSINSLANAVTNDVLVRVSLDNTKDWPVTHGLGHQVQTWDVVDRNANAVVWQPPTVNSSPTRVILLRASAPVSILVRFM